MDIEFHYYVTYLISARAGFSPADATIIAQSAQEVDDNHIPISVSAGTPAAYESAISQTMNILHPHHNRKIYPIFHFIPGDADWPGAARKDGLRSNWVTTPNSPLANALFDTALASRNLYRIGASAHAYADSWAHQNFTGQSDLYNEMPDASFGDKLEGRIALLRIGHALAGHRPDIPALIWRDDRLAERVVDNNARFLDAARHLFLKLHAYKTGAASDAGRDALAASLASDLKADFGPPSVQSMPRDPARIARYCRRALETGYGGAPIPPYLEAKWADAAFVEKRGGIATRIAEFVASHTGLAGDVLEFGTRMQYTWQDPGNFRQTHWYGFQEAIKAHLAECWSVLVLRFPELAA